jgi:hypothetical protein
MASQLSQFLKVCYLLGLRAYSSLGGFGINELVMWERCWVVGCA